MDDVNENNNGMGTSTAKERVRKAGIRAREMRDGALHTITDTPGWVWALVAGVILLMIGVMAASRYRARHIDQDMH